MDVQELRTEVGYIRIELGTEELVTQYRLIVHIVEQKELVEVLSSFRELAKSLQKPEWNRLISEEIESLSGKIFALIPHRSKRGLFNLGGRMAKWLYGTLDDEDLQNIEAHFSVLDTNNHNLISTLNQQVTTNMAFNTSITRIKQAIDMDRKVLLGRLNSIDKGLEELSATAFFAELMFKLGVFKDKVEHLQESVSSARLGLLQPNILTRAEIEEYDVDFQKLTKIRTGVAAAANGRILLVIKVPGETTRANKQALVPLPDKNGKEVQGDITLVLEVNNTTYEYEDDASFRMLKKSKSCMLTRNCAWTKNTRTEIVELDEGTLVAKNLNHTTLFSSCGNKTQMLTGSFLLSFNNCSIRLAGKNFSNRISYFEEKFARPSAATVPTWEKKLTFEEIALLQVENIQAKKELRFHRLASYSIGGGTIAMVAIGVLLILKLRAGQGKL